MQQPQKVDFQNLQSTLKNLIESQQAETLIGAMQTTQGILVILFSHRFNREIPILVPGTEASKIIQKVKEIYG